MNANINEKTKVNPKIFAMFPCLAFSSVIPISFIQMVPKTLGLYHTNPTTKLEREATKIAGKLISSIIDIVYWLVYQK